MAVVAFHKVTALPGTPDPDSFYLVENGSYAEIYLTDDAGVAKMVGNTTMIEAIAIASVNMLRIVADITARDALSLTSNTFVLVQDATDDVTVASGAALYVWVQADTQFAKVAEYESMDASIDWSDVQNRPSSSVANIDDAVTKRHAHSNTATLDLLSNSGGALTYNGSPVDTKTVVWNTVNW